MAATTARYAFPYQEATDPPNGATLGQNLATAVEASLGTVEDAHDARLDVLEARTTGKPIGRATQTVAQALPDATFTAITFTAEDYDTHGFHSTSTNTSRITPTVAGYYRFTGTVTWEGQTTGVGLDAHFRLNGTTSIAGAVRIPGTTTIAAQQLTVTVAMNGTTDYIELMGRQDSAGSDNTQVNPPLTSAVEWEYVRPL
ncbi:hypothetical protein [Actinoplanes sp. NPDC049802]|uniref:hypothetical protein n=1 Tax=Actinoplanes sp. NPDC049802 TaxID=3154742 RepID=UPI0033DC8818